MDINFSLLSASRIAPRIYPLQVPAGEDIKSTKFIPDKNPMKYILTTHELPGDLPDKFVDARICFRDLSSVTREDLELLGCTDKDYQNSLLDRFKYMANQEPNYTQILESEEAQNFNEIILKKASSHLSTMCLGILSAYYKLNIIDPQDVVVGEEHYASRFVLNALAELQHVTDEIETQLDALAKENPHFPNDARSRGSRLRLSILLSAVLGIGVGFWIWKTVKCK